MLFFGKARTFTGIPISLSRFADWLDQPATRLLPDLNADLKVTGI
jgi:hypothetical protein